MAKLIRELDSATVGSLTGAEYIGIDPSSGNSNKLSLVDAKSVSEKLRFATASYSTNTYTVTYTPAFTALNLFTGTIMGMTLVANTDAAGDPNISVNGLSGKLRKFDNTTYVQNEVLAGNYLVQYDGTNFRVLGGTGTAYVLTVNGTSDIETLTFDSDFTVVSAGGTSTISSSLTANQTIDHTTVNITGANGLTGGGAITANRTLSVSVSNSPEITELSTGDLILVDNGGTTSHINVDNISSGFTYPLTIDFNTSLSTTRIVALHADGNSKGIVTGSESFDTSEVDSVAYESRQASAPSKTFTSHPSFTDLVTATQSYNGVYFVKVTITPDAAFTGVTGVHFKYKA